jgi:hypothetical protein
MCDRGSLIRHLMVSSFMILSLKVIIKTPLRSVPRQAAGRSQAEFFEYVRKLKNYQTTVNTNGAGMSISYKRAEK